MKLYTCEWNRCFIQFAKDMFQTKPKTRKSCGCFSFSFVFLNAIFFSLQAKNWIKLFAYSFRISIKKKQRFHSYTLIKNENKASDKSNCCYVGIFCISQFHCRREVAFFMDVPSFSLTRRSMSYYWCFLFLHVFFIILHFHSLMALCISYLRAQWNWNMHENHLVYSFPPYIWVKLYNDKLKSISYNFTFICHAASSFETIRFAWANMRCNVALANHIDNSIYSIFNWTYEKVSSKCSLHFEYFGQYWNGYRYKQKHAQMRASIHVGNATTK